MLNEIKPPSPAKSKLAAGRDKSLHGVPPPRLYLYFDAIIRHGSIRSAAESLRIASSALNRRVLDLERELGTSLFDRLPSGVRLTPAGEIFAAHVRRTLNDARQVGHQIHNVQGIVSGLVAIGSAESAAIGMLPKLLGAIRAEFSGIRFTLAVDAPAVLQADLLEDRVDLILTHETPNHYDIAIITATRMPFCALMRAGHPLAGSATLLMADCEAFPVVLAHENFAARALVDAAMSDAALKLQPVLITNMFEVMKKFVAITDAISFQFHAAPFTDATLEGLVAIPLADPQLAQAQLTLAVRRGRSLPRGAAMVVQRLKAVMQPR